MPKRFARLVLRLHAVKTRLVQFVLPDREREGYDHSFDLLGVTHFCRRPRRGRWVTQRKTTKDRLRRALRVKDWRRAHRHKPVNAQYATSSRKLQGHYGHDGIIGNRSPLHRLHVD